jgi:LmbE family N-acetylglucosaminyl deacetylase
MSLVVDVEHPGTSEELWAASVRLRELPPVAVPTANRALIVAPHPDDEVLGAGGLLQKLLSASMDIEVLAITDGEASHPLSAAARAIDLATVRADEVVTSLRRLGWDQPEVTRLGIPDGHVESFEGDVAAAVRRRLGPGDLCLAPWSRDGHPDHDAAGRASEAVSVEVGATLLGFLVWAWHWADPMSPDLPWDRLARLDLSPGEWGAKRRAVRSFRSQIRPLGPDPEDAPVLLPPVLRRFARDYEVYVLGHQGP